LLAAHAECDDSVEGGDVKVLEGGDAVLVMDGFGE
jgi:hypothetical protein